MYHRYSNRSPAPRTITVKYAGTCACCGARIEAGEMADYHPTLRKLAHIGGLDGNSSTCAVNIRKQNEAREARCVANYVAEGLGEW